MVNGSTPLAGAMCGAVDLLEMFPADTKILQVSSDGEENSTPLGTPCHGDLYSGGAPFPSSSWQAMVLNFFVGKPVITQVDLFNSLPILLTTHAQDASDPEGILTTQARLSATTPSISTGLTPLEEFFTILTQSTGGQLNVIRDDAPLPVPGDLNGDRCVNHTDAILVARAFGPLVPPTTNGRYDLNLDGTVDFSDYQLQRKRITTTCGPDPYVPRAPLVCKGGKGIVIDSQSIEDGGVTIDARGSCEITIKNSLIVSGQNAITVVGKARITVDNSIIVGQNAVIVQHGGGVISAGNTVFHGKTSFEGSLQFIDRGGNVFE
ncbi:MAG TPA: dockerin type I domain-containing protein [Kofleriaceae bacterium]|nr:dockerin type I domain-containing protein [Kofleriaceae bacterium]